MPAAPIPPPIHIVTIPNWEPRRFISLMICTVSLAPVQPNGWPKAMAPPLTFSFAIVALLLLLAFEMVDRVLVRDEIQIARQLQRDLLPKASPDLPGYAFAHSSRTANDIGGDYYQFHRLRDGRLAIVVADASGHGMAAGLLMAIADATLHIVLELDPSPVAVSVRIR